MLAYDSLLFSSSTSLRLVPILDCLLRTILLLPLSLLSYAKMAMDPFGLTGLFVALVALIIALLQVLQVLFATAVGYRNCRPAIMGDWGNPKLTRRKFVPGEMRFETIYTVPYITMCNIIPSFTSNIDGSDTSRAKTYCTVRSHLDWKSCSMTSEMVTWAYLLDQVHNLGAAYSNSLESTPSYQARAKERVLLHSVPTVAMRERSWDFTPQEVNKPQAGEPTFIDLLFSWS